MDRVNQVGIAVIALGIVVALIALFPGVIGLEQPSGLGILQILVLLAGLSALILGAYIFVQNSYYHQIKRTLAQQIAIRISLTGLLISTASGLADVLGFGSHPPVPGQRPYFGVFQAAGVIGGFLIASMGVVVFTLMGHHNPPDEPQA